MHRTAQCACGAATITVSGEPQTHVVCHCSNCKRRTGSAFGISTYFAREHVVQTSGETEVYAFHHTAQNHDQQRHFCKRCGTTLFWTLSTMPALIGVAGGCFAEQDLGEPRMSVTHSKKMAWLELPATWKTNG
jgi:hypothetical protein